AGDEVVDVGRGLAGFDVEVDAREGGRGVAVDEGLEVGVVGAGERSRGAAGGNDVLDAGADEVLHVRRGDRGGRQAAPGLAAAGTGGERPGDLLELGRL